MHTVNRNWETNLILSPVQDSGYTTVSKTKPSPRWFSDQFSLVCLDFPCFTTGCPLSQKPFSSRQTRTAGQTTYKPKPLEEWSCGSIRDETYDFRLRLASFSSPAQFPSSFICQSFTPATHTLLMLIFQPTVDTLWLNFHRWVSMFKSTPYCHWNNRMLKPL